MIIRIRLQLFWHELNFTVAQAALVFANAFRTLWKLSGCESPARVSHRRAKMAAESAIRACIRLSELVCVCFPGLRNGGATTVTDVADIWLHVEVPSSDAHSGLIAIETESADVALA